MSEWRLSKYDPQQRHERAHFKGDDWTSAHDVGHRFGSGVLSIDEYLRVEQAYIDAVRAFHADAGSPEMIASAVEVQGAQREGLPRLQSVPPPEGGRLTASNLPDVIRACLREELWCRLRADAGEFCIGVGYDYYLYVAGVRPQAKTLELVRASGLFLEEKPWIDTH